jgi:tRNA threonylcarbamoyl adenosine modification protein YeaZ
MEMKEELKYLVIDTSIENITKINLIIGSKNSEIIFNESRNHLQNLIPGIKKILNQENLDLQNLNFIALNEGPGSWTGLRIGFATIKVLAMVNKLPVILFNNFDLIKKTNKVVDGLLLIKSSDINFYFREILNNEIKEEGIISEINLLDRFNLNPKFYLEENFNVLKEMIEEKFSKENFSDVFEIEPNYITEGLITSKFEKKL